MPTTLLMAHNCGNFSQSFQVDVNDAQQSVQRIGVESARSEVDLCKFLEFVGCGSLTPTANANRWLASAKEQMQNRL